MGNESSHSVTLNKKKCIGCTDCIKRCPTEAIRVRGGKAIIVDEKCIDCGMCIKICTHKAKVATTGSLKDIENYKFKVAIPAPTFYAQFDDVDDINKILSALKKIGFDDVYEVSTAAEYVTAETKKLIDTGDVQKPVISSACPATIRLISMRYPSLIEHILPLISPMELAAIWVRDIAISQGYNSEDIGIFFISPCAAKSTNIRNPLGIEKSNVDGVISMGEIYMRMRTELKKLSDDEIEYLRTCQYHGVEWAGAGGEVSGLSEYNIISVDGVDNVIKVMEEIENGQLDSVDFVEALACTGGCLGGPLAIKNPYIAKNYLVRTIRKARANYYDKRLSTYGEKEVNASFTVPLEVTNSYVLHPDRSVALQMLRRSKEIYDTLPHIDCGSCGAPNCKAHADDVTIGFANTEDCIFMLRDRVRVLAKSMVNLAEKLPPSLADATEDDENKGGN